MCAMDRTSDARAYRLKTRVSRPDARELGAESGVVALVVVPALLLLGAPPSDVTAKMLAGGNTNAMTQNTMRPSG